MRSRWTGWALAAPVMVALLVGGCGADGGSGGDTAAEGGAAQAGPAPEPAKDDAAAAPGEAGPARDGSASAVQLVNLDNRIIRNASVRLEIGKGRLDRTIQEASRVVARHQGILAGSKTNAPDGGPAQGTVTFRVPNPQFEQTMAELKRLGAYRGESSDSTDVTNEYVDTKSQLDAWRAQEAVYLRLMGQAKTINDTLAVRSRLDEVQRNINRLQGQLNVLDDLTSLATINLELSEPGALPGDEPTNPFAQAWQTGVDGILFIAKALIVAVLWLAPLALIAGLVLVALRALRPSRPPAPPVPPAPAAPPADA